MVYVYVVASLLALASGFGSVYYYLSFEDHTDQYQLSEVFDGTTYAKLYREGIECFALRWKTRLKPETAKLVSKEELARIVGSCKRYPLHRHPYKPFKMYPGTKWCGRGHLARNYTDLGQDRDLDRCCRDHDHCPLVIHSRVKKFGLRNPSFYTSSHCSCDDGLYSCLKEADSDSALVVGRIYFNFVRVRCFKEYVKHGDDGKEQFLVKFRTAKRY